MSVKHNVIGAAASGTARKRVLQFCHGYGGPFLDVARQYAALFKDTPFLVTTVYLTGAPDAEVANRSASDEVVFLNYSSAGVRGLKLGAIKDIRRLARDREFVLCIAHRFKPVYIACLGTDLPVIGVHHAFGDYDRVGRRLFARAFRSRLRLLAVSDAVRDDIRARVPSVRVDTLYNRIDLDTLRREQLTRPAARAALGLPQDAWIVGNVGRLHPDKDQATLLRGFAAALPKLPPSSLLVIAGEGRLKEELERLSVELGINGRTRFLGQIKNVRRLFKAFDVFALTSDREPFGMVLLEAMAAGVPIVASNCGGAPEVIADVGCLFSFGDSDDLATRLVESSRANGAEKEAAIIEVLNKRFSDVAARRRFSMLLAQRNFAVRTDAP